MNLWNIGFAFLAVGIAIPAVYALYKFVLSPIAWYWRLSIIFILVGLVFLTASAVKDRLEASPPEEKV